VNINCWKSYEELDFQVLYLSDETKPIKTADLISIAWKPVIAMDDSSRDVSSSLMVCVISLFGCHCEEERLDGHSVLVP
jgi:hypothetical protein